MRLAVVANRLPISLFRDSEGALHGSPSAGGLVSALAPALDRARGLWIGWPGLASDPDELEPALARASEEVGYDIVPVCISQEDADLYYRGFANSVLWPLFHGLPDRCDFQSDYFEAYLRANELFADAVEGSTDGSYHIWVHDYHLLHLGKLLRHRQLSSTIGHFLHIPFPQPQNYLRLPWRSEILEALCAYDLLGFQTDRDRASFMQCLEVLFPEIAETATERGSLLCLEHSHQSTAIGVYPISTDFASFAELAQSEGVRERLADLRMDFGDEKVLLGVDRLDYTKGLLARIEAWEQVLDRRPDLIGKAALLQLVVPSRSDVPEYQAIKAELEELVGRVVGRFSTPKWSPIRYLYTSIDREELVALYRLADVAVVTPLCDGMNLVAKEFCAARVDERGVLLLSETAGAAAELAEHSLVINPFDTEALATAMERGLAMEDAEQVEHMRALRDVVRNHDVFHWARDYLRALRERPPAPAPIEPDEDRPWSPVVSWAGHGSTPGR